MYWAVSTPGPAFVSAYFTSGIVGSLSGVGAALFQGEQQMAGSVYSGAIATTPTFGFVLAFSATTVVSPEFTPWFYVRPNWSLVFSTNTTNQALSASLLWQDLDMSMLDQHELE